MGRLAAMVLCLGAVCRSGAAPEVAGSGHAPGGGGSAQHAEALWAVRCAACHGATGRGDSPHGQQVGAPDMALPRWQREISDASIASAIERGVRRTHPGRMTRMPAYDTLAPTEVAALVELVRASGRFQHDPNRRAR